MRLPAILVATLLLLSLHAQADLADDLSDLEGYTIVMSTKIDRWVSADGKESGDAFEGCDYGRTIVFSNGRSLTCRTYSYTYAYMPTAVILSNGSSFKMVVRDRIYDMTR